MVPFAEARKIGEEKFEEEDVEVGQRWNQDCVLTVLGLKWLLNV